MSPSSSNRARSGLGRGIGALIPGAGDMTSPPLPSSGSDAEALAQGVIEIPIEYIHPNPQQPRQVFEPRALLDLANSIKEHGIIQPLIVTRVGENNYQLIAGERRWQAAQHVGLKTVPVIIKDATPQQILELALVENIQRADLNPLEEAAAYRHLMQDFKLTQEQVATRVGKSRVTIANILRLLNLPDEVRQALADNIISEGHARALLPLESVALQHQALQLVISGPLTVRQTEELVRKLLDRGSKQARQIDTQTQQSVKDRGTAEAERTMENTLNMGKVEIQRIGSGGKLIIEFFSEEDLQRLYDILVTEAR